MQKGFSMPAPDGAGICTKLDADLLPRKTVDVPIFQNHALVGIRNCLNDLSYLFLKV